MPVPIAETIRCVECGARAHLLTGWPEDDPPRPGDVLPYRCEECQERFDIVVADEDDLEGPEQAW